LANPRSLFTEINPSHSSKIKIIKLLKSITYTLILCCVVQLSAQKRKYDKKLKITETITKELTFLKISSDNILVVDNIYGSINVEGYNGDTIKIEVVKTVYADT
jgi:hypothetical protein